MNTEKTYRIILLTFFGMLGSILIGIIFFQTHVFLYSSIYFQFIIGGLVGALFFGLLECGRTKEQIFGMLLIIILQFIIFDGRSISTVKIIRDIFYLSSLFLSVKLYHLFIKRYPEIKYYLRSLALVLIYGLVYTLFICIVYVINVRHGLPDMVIIYSIARIAVLIGLGLGIGIDFYLLNQKYLLSLLKIKAV